MGHLKAINFPFVLNVKLIIFKCPKIWAHFSLILMCSNIKTSKIINFPFGNIGKIMVLGAPIFKHFRVVDLRVHTQWGKKFDCFSAFREKCQKTLHTTENLKFNLAYYLFDQVL